MCMRRHVAPTPSRAALPARLRPAIPKGSRGRRCRDVHASTRSVAPAARARPMVAWSRSSPLPAVPLRTAPCSSGEARARPTVPVGPAAGRAVPREPLRAHQSLIIRASDNTHHIIVVQSCYTHAMCYIVLNCFTAKLVATKCTYVADCTWASMLPNVCSPTSVLELDVSLALS